VANNQRPIWRVLYIILAQSAIEVSGRKVYDVKKSEIGVNRMSANWRTDGIPDLTGKVIIATGANRGLGYEAAKEFARKGAQPI